MLCAHTHTRIHTFTHNTNKSYKEEKGKQEEAIIQEIIIENSPDLKTNTGNFWLRNTIIINT